MMLFSLQSNYCGTRVIPPATQWLFYLMLTCGTPPNHQADTPQMNFSHTNSSILQHLCCRINDLHQHKEPCTHFCFLFQGKLKFCLAADGEKYNTLAEITQLGLLFPLSNKTKVLNPTQAISLFLKTF